MSENYNFLKACSSGDLKLAIQLMEDHPIDINYVDLQGASSLMYAAYHGFSDVVDYLIYKNADLNIKSGLGSTALIYALYKHNPYIVQQLIIKGADLDIKTNRRRTALTTAISKGLNEIALLLIDGGADQSIKDFDGWTAYDIAVTNGNLPLVFILGNNPINHQDDEGNTILIKSCQDKDEKSVIFLYGRGADFSITNLKSDSAYNILKRKRSLSPGLQALKEKLVLEFSIDNDATIYNESL